MVELARGLSFPAFLMLDVASALGFLSCPRAVFLSSACCAFAFFRRRSVTCCNSTQTQAAARERKMRTISIQPKTLPALSLSGTAKKNIENVNTAKVPSETRVEIQLYRLRNGFQ